MKVAADLRSLEEAGRAEALKRVLRRGILLFLIGIFYSGGFTNHWPDMRLMGVLNRIALAYLFAGLLFCFFSRAWRSNSSAYEVVCWHLSARLSSFHSDWRC